MIHLSNKRGHPTCGARTIYPYHSTTDKNEATCLTCIKPPRQAPSYDELKQERNFYRKLYEDTQLKLNSLLIKR